MGFPFWQRYCTAFFFSSPNLSGHRLDVYRTSAPGVALSANLQCRSETCCARLAANTERKKWRQPNFAALNRGRHLYSAGRLSRWALAHISSIVFLNDWTDRHWINAAYVSLESWDWLHFSHTKNVGEILMGSLCYMLTRDKTRHRKSQIVVVLK